MKQNYIRPIETLFAFLISLMYVLFYPPHSS